jgi:GxxExxY protein
MLPQLLLRINTKTEAIIGAAIDVHRALGPGLLESVYFACLVYELRHRGLAMVFAETRPRYL